MNKVHKIVALSGSATAVTLYTATGETILIRTNEKAIHAVCSDIIPALERGETPLYAEPVSDNPFSSYQKESKLVKFFAIAKDKVKALLNIQEDIQENRADLSVLTKYLEEHATPASDPKAFLSRDFKKDISLDVMEQRKEEDDDTDTTDTVVALVKESTPIVGAETMQKQIMQHSADNSTEAVDAFFLRLANKIKCGHTPKDLLRFMEVADLPLAKDGTILAYKVLRRREDAFVDCHTQKITQWVGSIVEMPAELVDPNRNQDCSHGIHIANRRYIRDFGGDVCVLCSIAPEDVIAVPAYSRFKMRVRKYHILDLLTPTEYSLLKGGKPITDCADGVERLRRARNLEYPAATTHVQLLVPTVAKATDFNVTDLNPVTEPVMPVTDIEPETTVLPANSLDSVAEGKVTPVSVTDMVKVQRGASQFKELFPITTTEAALRAIELKRRYKKSWKALGVLDEDAKKIEKLAKG